MTFVPGRVVVTVPATSANLGPGFDTLGLALELRDELVGEVTESGLVIEVSGEGAEDVPCDETHLVVRAMGAAFDRMGAQPAGLRLTCHNRIPHARGLGSSSAAIVGGIALARALVEDGDHRLDDGRILALATAIEGHPDNVAPALYGGFVISGQDGKDVWADQSPVDRRIRAVVFIPSTPLRTEAARALLPETVSHADAAANTGRAALLVSAIADAPERLHRATEDFLHQSYRRPAMPDSLALVDSLRAGGHAAVISGAGPTVLVLTVTDTADLLPLTPEGWSARPLEVATTGVRQA